MAQYQSQSIPQDKFLLISVNLLHKAFIEALRTDAKNVYKTLSRGQQVYLTTVEMEDRSTVRFNLAMDASEFKGKLNYGAFRASLATLLGHITEVLRDRREVNVFNAREEPDTVIFGITAVTLVDDTPNVMVLGANTAAGQAEITLRLLYLEPTQFTAEPAPSATV